MRFVSNNVTIGTQRTRKCFVIFRRLPACTKVSDSSEFCQIRSGNFVLRILESATVFDVYEHGFLRNCWKSYAWADINIKHEEYKCVVNKLKRTVFVKNARFLPKFLVSVVSFLCPPRFLPEPDGVATLVEQIKEKENII